ncbi:MAG: hypothetical protein GXC76_04460 [Rhodanobacteraceae bacterium]|jgi:hypothetical protein|nr:hypothetical protein [Rhodanobacteraceae bacterium]
MNARPWATCLLAGGLWVCAGLQAATLDEDEARIAELMRAELARPAPVQGSVATPGQAATAAAAEAAPVVAEVVAPPPPPPSAHDDWLVPATRDAGLPFDDLAHRIGRRVTIVTTGERVHRGTVQEADARRVVLVVRRPGGDATYTLRREQVVRIERR